MMVYCSELSGGTVLQRLQFVIVCDASESDKYVLHSDRQQ